MFADCTADNCVIDYDALRHLSPKDKAIIQLMSPESLRLRRLLLSLRQKHLFKPKNKIRRLSEELPCPTPRIHSGRYGGAKCRAALPISAPFLSCGKNFTTAEGALTGEAPGNKRRRNIPAAAAAQPAARAKRWRSRLGARIDIIGTWYKCT